MIGEGSLNEPVNIEKANRSMMETSNLEDLAAALEDSPDYRVLRRLRPRLSVEGLDAVDTRLGLMVDVETTGLDPDHDEIIELAMVPFRYTLDGVVCGTGRNTTLRVATDIPR